MPLLKQFEHLKIQLEAIKSATNNFADDNCIGKGGFGKVYKGELGHSKGHTIVAIKRLDRRFGQGNPEFWKEIIMLSQYKHENIVSLLGFGDESDEKILVYEYASNGSLDKYLNNDNLTWIQRLNICIGAARGLAYLHNPGESQQRVLHRDIKSSNILLDQNWNARISDLGLSKLGPANQQYTFLVSNTVGTFGYCDPLYLDTGLLTKESDVYSFGVVLFEVLCGRLSIDSNNDTRRSLTSLVRQYYKANKINELVYSNILDEIHPRSLKAFTAIAYQCLKIDHEQRPLMAQVVSMLEDALGYQLGTLQANAESISKVVDIIPRIVDDLDKTESWMHVELGSWEKRKVISRHGHMKLEALVFFASIDQNGGNEALAVVLADWFQHSSNEMPTKSRFDRLIIDGSIDYWRNLCGNRAYTNLFPDKRFDLQTVLEAKIRNLDVVPEKSFIGFFRPEELKHIDLAFLDGAMSFDDIWDEISNIGSSDTYSVNPLVYIVSWSDHYSVLKVERDAYYIIDTLGETLYEGCNQAYILKFDRESVIERISVDTQRSIEIVCKGKESCKEYIKSFMSAIPLRELQADLEKGLVATIPVHHRLQIEFHHTTCSLVQ